MFKSITLPIIVYPLLINFILIAVGVTLTSLDLNVTEGDPFVEVCVEIVVGTVSEEGTVEVETISGTATGKLDYDVQLSFIMGDQVQSS